VVAFTIGPAVILRLFGPEFPIDRRTVGLLALASAFYMLANTLAQALIALGEPTQVAMGWGAGVVAMAVVLVVGNDPLFTVELAFVIATAVAIAAMAMILGRARRQGATPTTEGALEAINDIAFEV
jgi:O-antigen/teichoic acid export membrane protein